MTEPNRIVVKQVRDRTIVRFVDKKIIDSTKIQQMGRELAVIVLPNSDIALDFEGVEFLSSEALNKLLQLDAKVKRLSGRLRLYNLRSQVNEVFTITRLNRVLDIRQANLNDDDLEPWGAWVPTPTPSDNLDDGIQRQEPHNDEYDS